MQKFVSDYTQELQKEFITGRAREHSYRPALKNLIQALCPEVTATNEPSREKCGAPDFVFIEKEVPVGYAEVKDIGVDLDIVEKSDQMERYHVLQNLFLSDYLEFRFYLDKGKYDTIKIGSLENGKLVFYEAEFQKLALCLKSFCQKPSQTINSAEKLAQMMADKARLMKEIIYKALTDKEQEEGMLNGQLEAFRRVLLHDMTESEFADIYAQTIGYGLFVARYHDTTLQDFSRREAADLMPKSNPFLRKMFHQIAGYDLDVRIAWIVDALADVFLHTDIKSILENFGNATKRNDPVIHFYETFLAFYDKKLRKARGVYYTPEPVVSFIVRSINKLLKSEFNLSEGLADTSKTTIKTEGQGKYKKDREQKQEVHKVQLLDPATGTGTFLNEVIKFLYQNTKYGKAGAGIWNPYVKEHLLPRLNGFELMMAAYTMCHLKLGLTLMETGYTEDEERLRVYLTNSLEEAHEDHATLFSTFLSEESNEATWIKREMPIMVVLGNPPYSVSSANKGEWIQNLLKDYKKDLNEKNIQPLSDDYIKFIRYAQYNIEKNGQGIVAMITNNSFIDGVIHRQMRKSLLETFDKIFIYDLHGNSKKKETAPDGSADQNVFDIMQGVSINIFVKTSNSKKLGEVYHYDSYGKRKDKYERLWESDVDSVEWEKLETPEPYYFFVPKNFEAEQKYKLGFGIEQIFNAHSSGIQTEKDKIAIHFEKDSIQKIISDLENQDNDYLISEYNESLKKITIAKNDILQNKGEYFKLAYKPFDIRFSYFTGKTNGFMGRPRTSVMKDFIGQKNLGLIVKRGMAELNSAMGFVSKGAIDRRFWTCPGMQGAEQLFPLYLYKKDGDEGQKKLEI